MSKARKIFDVENRKVLLSALWIFAMFNYVYGDILTLMNPEELSQILSGQVGNLHMTPEFLLSAAMLMETAIIMTLLSRILAYGINRWLNVVLGTVHTSIMFASMFIGSSPTPHYIFLGVIEMITTGLIVLLALRWKKGE